MKLYDVPKNSKIQIQVEGARGNHPPAHRDFEDGEELTLHNIDGMYSRCTDKDGNTVHLSAWTEVVVLDG